MIPIRFVPDARWSVQGWDGEEVRGGRVDAGHRVVRGQPDSGGNEGEREEERNFTLQEDQDGRREFYLETIF